MADNEERTGNPGDKSGKGRERQPDEKYPQGRDSDEMGTHGGAKRHGAESEPEQPQPSQRK